MVLGGLFFLDYFILQFNYMTWYGSVKNYNPAISISLFFIWKTDNLSILQIIFSLWLKEILYREKNKLDPNLQRLKLLISYRKKI